ncbi:MAG: AAA family ATPase [Cyanobacteria bacterium P01_H01_bin.162]
MTPPVDIPVWLLIGLPGSGKSTWASHFNQSAPPLVIISTDQIRAQLFGHAATQGPWPQVWHSVNGQLQTTVQQAQQGNISGAIYDATNVQRQGRHTVIQAARAAGFTRLSAVWFDVPTALCLQRNRQRSRQVPTDVIETMARQLAGAPPHCDEGFDALYRLQYSDEAIATTAVPPNRINARR